ncbi:MAG: PBP1A family penicillin-binding protein [Candidatus Levybacteria bacterium]|nr:PBP1A family penicillin-binding protein [Candidatus Levybacteria bacterium]
MFDYRPRRRRSSVGLFSLFTISRLTKYLFFAAVAGVIAVPLLFLWYSRDLPTPGKIVVSKYADATRIYDRKGVLLYSVYEDQNRTYVPLSEIPKDFREATISIEDKDFYKNPGLSLVGMVRAVINMVTLKGGLASGSTITQQLVKNTLLTSEQTLPRKVKEMVLAVQVDKKFTKDQILEMYVNNIPYGAAAIGVEAASETYFGKKAKDLNLAQSAFLAGLPQSPTSYSPFSAGDEKLYIGRTQAVLRQMRENGYIARKEEQAAFAEIKNYKFSRKETQIKAPHFVMFVRKQLEEKFGEQFVMTGGLQVTTTLDYDLQKESEEIVKEEVDKLKKYNATNAGALITNPKTGEILAMVGSKDYYDDEDGGAFNVVWQAERQPGSSLKPLIYAAAFEKGYTPASLLMDVKTEFATDDPSKPYNPVNYDGKFRGPVQVRFALGNSLNIPAVKMLTLVGLNDAMQKAYEMGITNWQPTSENLKSVGLSLVLGGRETTLHDEVVAYGVFANKGVRQDPTPLLKVTDPKGKKLYEFKKRDGQKVLSEEVAFLISHILHDNVARTEEFGSNSYLRIPGRSVAAKTGTTDEKRDNWTIGYTPSVVVGVWVGNNDNSPMNPVIASGVTGASPIWHRLMTQALKGKPQEEFAVPSNVTAVQIDSLFGGTPFGSQATRTEYFIKGTEPTTNSPIYQRDFYIIKEDDPVSKDGRNRWQEGIDTWINEAKKDDSKWHPPDDVKNPKSGGDPTPTPDNANPTETPTPTA